MTLLLFWSGKNYLEKGKKRKQLLSWSIILLEKLIVGWVVKKFPAFYKQKVRCCFQKNPPLISMLRQMNLVHTLNPCFLRLISILRSHLRLDFPSDLFYSGFPAKTVTHFSSSHACCTPRPPYSPLFDYPNNFVRRVRIIKLLILQFLQPFLT